MRRDSQSHSDLRNRARILIETNSEAVVRRISGKSEHQVFYLTMTDTIFQLRPRDCVGKFFFVDFEKTLSDKGKCMARG